MILSSKSSRVSARDSPSLAESVAEGAESSGGGTSRADADSTGPSSEGVNCVTGSSDANGSGAPQRSQQAFLPAIVSETWISVPHVGHVRREASLDMTDILVTKCAPPRLRPLRYRADIPGNRSSARARVDDTVVLASKQSSVWQPVTMTHPRPGAKRLPWRSLGAGDEVDSGPGVLLGGMGMDVV